MPTRILHIIIAAAMALAGTLACHAAPAAQADSLNRAAEAAYSADNFALAAELYEQAVALEPQSAALRYNLGNAMYRLGRPGAAILNYERALRLNPAMSEARANLEFVNSRITDRPGQRGTFVGNALDAAANAATSDAWAWIATGLFMLCLGGIAAYAFATSVGLRKAGFFGGGAALLLSIVALIFSTRAARIARSDAEAIVMTPSTILSTSPRTPANRAQEAMLLHEGTKVWVRDSVRSAIDSLVWLDVEVDNTHRAWLRAVDAERIKQ